MSRNTHQTGNKKVADKIADEINRAELARCNALTKADAGALGSLLADDFLYVHASGRTEDKNAYIGSISSGAFSLKGFERRKVTVQKADNTAVMSGEIAVTRQEGQDTRVTDFAFLGVWSRNAESWRLLYWKHTKI